MRACGRLLVDAGAVEDRYVDAMLDVVRQMGPYIVIAPGIAMPHARPTDGVHHNAFSLVRTRTAVEFGNADNDPATLLVGLAAGDKDPHVTALRQLVSLIGDRHNVETMRNARRDRAAHRRRRAGRPRRGRLTHSSSSARAEWSASPWPRPSSATNCWWTSAVAGTGVASDRARASAASRSFRCRLALPPGA